VESQAEVTAEDIAANPRMPIWSRMVILLALAGLASLFASGISTIFAIQDVAKHAQDPVQMAKAAHDIASFPEPLPDGFNYVTGIDLPSFGLDMVTIQHEPDKQMFSFFSAHGLQDDADAKTMLDYGYSNGLWLGVTYGRFTGIPQKNGTIEVAGQEMPYAIGDAVDTFTGKKGQGMVGCVQIPVKDTRKNIFIYALQTGEVPYNQQITLDLLNSIKSF
jgi:hypothetical protein